MLAVATCLGLAAAGVVFRAWQGSGESSIEALAVDPSNPHTVYAGTWGGGVFKSTDGGERWNAINHGLGNTDVFSLGVDPSSSETVYAGTLGGVFGSRDGGATWKHLGLTRTAGEEGVTALAIDPARPQTLYAALPDSGLIKSTNAGGSWSRVSDSPTHALAIDPQRRSTLFAGTCDLFGGGVVETRDGGRTWRGTGLVKACVDALALAPSRPGTIYVSVTAGADGLFKSTDGGVSWRRIEGAPFTLTTNGIAISPLDPETVYVAFAAVHMTTDGGRTWQVVLTEQGINGSYSAIAVDSTRPQTIYAGSANGRVFKSTDGGRTWRAADLG